MLNLKVFIHIVMKLKEKNYRSLKIVSGIEMKNYILTIFSYKYVAGFIWSFNLHIKLIYTNYLEF